MVVILMERLAKDEWGTDETDAGPPALTRRLLRRGA